MFPAVKDYPFVLILFKIVTQGFCKQKRQIHLCAGKKFDDSKFQSAQPLKGNWSVTSWPLAHLHGRAANPITSFCILETFQTFPEMKVTKKLKLLSALYQRYLSAWRITDLQFEVLVLLLAYWKILIRFFFKKKWVFLHQGNCPANCASEATSL